MIRIFVFLAAALAAAAPAAAQGSLSTQGFGYPPGQVGARSASMGGGTAEVDNLSLLNPAALANWGSSGLYVEYQPEYRTVSSGGQTDHTMTSRFPQAQGALTLGRRLVLDLSTSTLLDRTWQTRRTGYEHRGGPDSTQFTELFKSQGAINDIQLGVAFGIFQSLWIGAGAHAYGGDNLLSISRSSTDTTVGTFTQQSSLSYSGSGVSGGIVWAPAAGFTLGVSGRVGGSMKSLRNDTTLTRATIPKRFGVGLSIQELPGVTLAARADWEGWSSLNGLGSSTLVATDAWDVGGGIEVRGPALAGSYLPLRAGYRERTLPFLVAGTRVRERTYSVGASLPLVRGRSRIDLGLARANRTALAGIAEHAWLFTAGFMIRP